MKINTKYNIGDTVWTLDNYGKIIELKINKLDIQINDREGVDIVYLYGDRNHRVRETNMFDTKITAGVALMRVNGLEVGLNEQ